MKQGRLPVWVVHGFLGSKEAKDASSQAWENAGEESGRCGYGRDEAEQGKGAREKACL
ncbi:MAG TPA: hypothetical protein PK843_15535 [bacterium]|nr:hypothetical protein [bacterium]HPN35927.1 hypothetical protein [bacterium]